MVARYVSGSISRSNALHASVNLGLLAPNKLIALQHTSTLLELPCSGGWPPRAHLASVAPPSPTGASSKSVTPSLRPFNLGTLLNASSGSHGNRPASRTPGPDSGQGSSVATASQIGRAHV